MSDATQRITKIGSLSSAYAGTDILYWNPPINGTSASSIELIMRSRQLFPERIARAMESPTLSICTQKPKQEQRSSSASEGKKMKGTCTCGKKYDYSKRKISRADKFGKTLRCQCGNIHYEGKKYRWNLKV